VLNQRKKDNRILAGDGEGRAQSAQESLPDPRQLGRAPLQPGEGMIGGEHHAYRGVGGGFIVKRRSGSETDLDNAAAKRSY
jgi:hypothetical protein